MQFCIHNFKVWCCCILIGFVLRFYAGVEPEVQKSQKCLLIQSVPGDFQGEAGSALGQPLGTVVSLLIARVD